MHKRKKYPISSNMGKVKAHQLRQKTRSDLLTQIEDLRGELNNVSNYFVIF